MRIRPLVLGACAATLFCCAAMDAAVAAAAKTVSNCVSEIEGVDPSGTVQFASVYTDPSPTFYKDDQPLGFRPAHLAAGGTGYIGDVDQPTTLAYRFAQATDGTLRLITDSYSEFDGTPFHGRDFTTIALGYRLLPRLFTFAPGTSNGEAQYMFRVSSSGYLYRDTYHAATASKAAYFDGTVGLGRDLLNARTLTAHDRITLDGQRTDVLFGTTKYGRLFVTTVPLAHPTQARSTVLVTSGFGGYDYLAADPQGGCNDPDRQYDHVLVGVNSAAHTGRIWALTTVHHPTSADLAPGAALTIEPDLSAVH